MRVLHWGLALAITLAWLSTVVVGIAEWHEPTGYAALIAVILRLVWGFAGSDYARFNNFVHAPYQVRLYLQQLRVGSEPRYLGHNPLGGWMIVLLLLTTVCVAVSGWLFTTDAFWGVAWVARLHEWAAWFLLGMIALHVLGVVYTSIRQRENLVAAMFTGRKRAAASSDH